MRTSRHCLVGAFVLALASGLGGAAVAQDEAQVAFPIGHLEPTDGHRESVRFDADGTCASFGPGWEMPCTYAINGNLFTETSYEGSMRYKFPATYRWDWDGERLSFEPWSRDDVEPRVAAYADRVYERAEE